MKKFFSIFSGICYEVNNDEVDLLDKGQVPLKDYPSKHCKKCSGKGFTGKDSKAGVYILCPCMVNLAEIDLKKLYVENVRLHSSS